MSQKVIKAGNSLAVTIPSRFVKNIGIGLGTKVKVETKFETGQLIFTFPGHHQLSFSPDFSKNQKKR